MGCGARGFTVPLITGYGRYPSPDGNMVLIIAHGKTDLVEFAVKDATTGRTICEGDLGSVSSRWAFAWNRPGILWMYSGDIGTSYMQFSPDGIATRVQAQRGDLKLQNMPATFRQYLSTSTRKALGL